MPKRKGILHAPLLTPGTNSPAVQGIIPSAGGPRALLFTIDESGPNTNNPFGSGTTMLSCQFNMNDLGTRGALVQWHVAWQQSHDGTPGNTSLSSLAGPPGAEITICTFNQTEQATVTDSSVICQGGIMVYSTFDPHESANPVEGRIQGYMTRFPRSPLYSVQLVPEVSDLHITTMDLTEDISVIVEVSSTDATGTTYEDIQGYALLWPMDDTWNWDLGVRNS